MATSTPRASSRAPATSRSRCHSRLCSQASRIRIDISRSGARTTASRRHASRAPSRGRPAQSFRPQGRKPAPRAKNDLEALRWDASLLLPCPRQLSRMSMPMTMTNVTTTKISSSSNTIPLAEISASDAGVGSWLGEPCPSCTLCLQEHLLSNFER